MVVLLKQFKSDCKDLRQLQFPDELKAFFYFVHKVLSFTHACERNKLHSYCTCFFGGTCIGGGVGKGRL